MSETAIERAGRRDKTIERATAAAGVLVLAAVPLLVTSPYYLSLASFIVVYGILCIGLVILFGFSGQISVAQAAFYGVGGYVSGILTLRSGLPPWLALVAGTFAAGLLGYLVSWPMLRLRHFYLALGTLAVGEMAFIFFMQAQSITGGPLGVIGIPPFSIGPLVLEEQSEFFLFAAVMLILVFALSRRLERSAFGHGLHAARNSELGAAMSGVNVRRAKMLAFAVAAAFAGLAGGLFAFQVSFISPDTFTVAFAITILTMVFIGGVRSIWGAILGAIFLTVLPELLSGYADVAVLIYGLALVLVVLFLPDGIMGLLTAARHAGERWLRRDRTGEGPVDRGDRETSFVAAAGAGLSAMLERTLPRTDQHDDVTSAAPAAALAVKGVSHSFDGLKVLSDVDFEVHDRSVTALIGPNGAGKTTLLNTISGAIPPREGRIALLGQEITGLPPHAIARRGMGRTFQSLNLFSDRTVLQNVVVAADAPRDLGSAAPARATWTGRRGHEALAMDVIEGLGLGSLARARVDELSFAAQRWTDVARALALRPGVMLMDEPASGLGADEIRLLKDLILQLRDHGLTVVLVEHNIQFVLDVADRVIVLEEGRIIFDGVPAEARMDPGVLEAYLGPRWMAAEAEHGRPVS